MLASWSGASVIEACTRSSTRRRCPTGPSSCPRRSPWRWCCCPPCWSASLAAMLVQLLKGYTNLELGKWLLWYVLPTGVDLITARRTGDLRPVAEPEQIYRLGRDGALHRRDDGLPEHRPRAQSLPLWRHAAGGLLRPQRLRHVLDSGLVVPASTGPPSPSSCSFSPTCCGGAAPRRVSGPGCGLCRRALPARPA